MSFQAAPLGVLDWVKYEYPLHMAVVNGDETTVRTFVVLHANNPEFINKRFQIPDWLKQAMQSPEVNSLETERFQALNGFEGASAFDLALNRTTARITDMILQCPALDLRTCNNIDQYPIHLSMTSPSEVHALSIIDSDKADLQQLYKYQANQYMSPIHLAALHGKTSVLRALFEKGVSMLGFDSLNRTPLKVALDNNQIETALAIIELDHTLLTVENADQSSLKHVLETENLVVLEAILKRDPNPLIFENDLDGSLTIYTILEYAISKNITKVIRFLDPQLALPELILPEIFWFPMTSDEVQPGVGQVLAEVEQVLAEIDFNELGLP